MKISSTGLLCCFALVALPCVALGVGGKHVMHLQEPGGHGLPALRGGMQTSRSPQPSSITSQASAAALLQLGEAETALTKKRVRRSSTKRSRSHTLRKRIQRLHQRSTLNVVVVDEAQLGRCRRNKLRWWIKVKRKCVKSFGKDSKWDRQKMDGKCAEAWSECNTGFYAVCCSQPVGPKDMEAYCAKQNLTFIAAADANKDGNKDKACQVQKQMKDVRRAMQGMKNTIILMNEDSVKPARLLAAPFPAPSPMPMPIPAQLLPPAGLVAPLAVSSLPAAGPAPAPASFSGPAPAPGAFGPLVMSPLENRCAMLTKFTREAAERIQAIKEWAKRDGIRESSKELEQKSKVDKVLQQSVDNTADETNPTTPEAKDPDMVFAVRDVMQQGDKLGALLQGASFCSKRPDDDEDDDDDDVEDDVADLEDDLTQDEGDEEEVTKINETAIMSLLSWEGDMTNSVKKFEKDVHPHGYKWWRYRCEYTVIESIVLAFSVMVLYFVMWLLHGASFFHAHKFYKTGLTVRLLRYAWGYLVFHAASLMVMVTTAYMLYMPWGEHNIFNLFATALHDFVDDRANVPFLGYSWLYMVLDVQFQLFACFALYSLFVLMIVSSYKTALEDWKCLSDGDEGSVQDAKNAMLYRHFDAIVRKRVANTPAYIKMFTELKLRVSGVESLANASSDWHNFKLHLYLTDGVGKSAEYFVEVSLTTHVFLAISALVLSLLAHHFEVAFMYFLPAFVVIGLGLFVASYFISQHLRALSDNDDYNTPAKYFSLHSFCRAIQVVLYCLFYSFSRLLLSNDILEHYTKVYVVSLVGLLVILALLAVFAGDVIKQTTCALILPPHISEEQLKKNLEQVVKWHTTEKCHECGSQQHPVYASMSREWAGQKPTGERPTNPGSARLYSWR